MCQSSTALSVGEQPLYFEFYREIKDLFNFKTVPLYIGIDAYSNEVRILILYVQASIKDGFAMIIIRWQVVY